MFKQNLNSKRRNAYSNDFIKEFIQLYKSLPSTWDFRTEHYRNRDKKANDYQLLINKWREVEPHADRSFVVSKINWLRCSARRDNERIKNGLSSTTWYRNLLSFLPKNPQCKRKNDMILRQFKTDFKKKKLKSFDEVIIEDTDDTDGYETESSVLKQDNPLSGETCSSHENQDFQLVKAEVETQADIPMTSIPYINRSLSKEVTTHFYPDTSVNNFLSQELQNNVSERLEYASKTWVEILKCLPRQQQVIAEKLINDVLYTAQMGNLNVNTPIEVSKILNSNFI